MKNCVHMYCYTLVVLYNTIIHIFLYLAEADERLRLWKSSRKRTSSVPSRFKEVTATKRLRKPILQPDVPVFPPRKKETSEIKKQFFEEDKEIGLNDGDEDDDDCANGDNDSDEEEFGDEKDEESDVEEEECTNFNVDLEEDKPNKNDSGDENNNINENENKEGGILYSSKRLPLWITLRKVATTSSSDNRKSLPLWIPPRKYATNSSSEDNNTISLPLWNSPAKHLPTSTVSSDMDSETDNLTTTKKDSLVKNKLESSNIWQIYWAHKKTESSPEEPNTVASNLWQTVRAHKETTPTYPTEISSFWQTVWDHKKTTPPIYPKGESNTVTSNLWQTVRAHKETTPTYPTVTSSFWQTVWDHKKTTTPLYPKGESSTGDGRLPLIWSGHFKGSHFEDMDNEADNLSTKKGYTVTNELDVDNKLVHLSKKSYASTENKSGDKWFLDWIHQLDATKKVASTKKMNTTRLPKRKTTKGFSQTKENNFYATIWKLPLKRAKFFKETTTVGSTIKFTNKKKKLNKESSHTIFPFTRNVTKKRKKNKQNYQTEKQLTLWAHYPKDSSVRKTTESTLISPEFLFLECPTIKEFLAKMKNLDRVQSLLLRTKGKAKSKGKKTTPS
ncbi:uncharacterized protein LOC142329023 [Lycorma delicatula]|uniref:uncharacterized protein LOC142329023 n=1 Tax=Lycorma delicatula TaxID=130591 RepID=UPI003F5108B3